MGGVAVTLTPCWPGTGHPDTCGCDSPPLADLKAWKAAHPDESASAWIREQRAANRAKRVAQ